MDRDPCVAYLSAWTSVPECGGGLVAGVADGERQKICENPRNNAKNPTQNKISYVRCANTNTRSDPDTQNANNTNKTPVTRFTHQ